MNDNLNVKGQIKIIAERLDIPRQLLKNLVRDVGMSAITSQDVLDMMEMVDNAYESDATKERIARKQQ